MDVTRRGWRIWLGGGVLAAGLTAVGLIAPAQADFVPGQLEWFLAKARQPRQSSQILKVTYELRDRPHSPGKELRILGMELSGAPGDKNALLPGVVSPEAKTPAIPGGLPRELLLLQPLGDASAIQKEMDRKLDAILHEIQMLRQEIRGPRPPR